MEAAELSAIDVHLRGCPGCAVLVADNVRLKRMARIAGRKFIPSAQFRQRVRRHIAARRYPGWLRGWAPALAALALLAVAGSGLVAGTQRARMNQAWGELCDLHVATLASGTPVDVVSSDRHTVKPWFQGKIPFTFDLPEFNNTEFALVGGRVAYFQQAPAAQLLVRIRGHHASVLIVQNQGAAARLPSEGAGKELAFRVRTWTAGGLRYLVISDAGPEDVERLCGMLQSALHS